VLFFWSFSGSKMGHLRRQESFPAANKLRFVRQEGVPDGAGKSHRKRRGTPAYFHADTRVGPYGKNLWVAYVLVRHLAGIYKREMGLPEVDLYV
jgi:hypothetical protein